MAGNIKGITIEIGGDTTKLEQALKKVNTATREVNKELREINKSLKFNPGNTELIAQKQRALGDAIENTKSKLETLKTAHQQAQQALAEGKIGQQQYDALTREILKTENQLKSLEGQLNTINSKWVQVGESLQKAGSKFQQVGQSLANVGQSLTTKLTVPLVGIGTASAKLAIDFESAMAGVAKTVDMTDAEFEQMSQSIRDMAKELPASTTEIAAVAEAAGQLGIEKENILEFTRTMIDLGESTNLTADQAATAFARFANITQMPQDAFDKLGSTVVALGNNFATTEAEIVEMGMRLAATGSQIGLTEAEIMGLATALSSVGVQAEAGGTAMSTVMTKINKAVGEGGESLEKFAQVSGTTAEQFASVWQASPAQALEMFVAGLGNAQESGQNLDTVLADLGITGIRETDTIKRLAGAADLLPDAFEMANKAFEENTALSDEASKRYETMQSQIDMTVNKLKDVGITLGQIVMPYVMDFVDWLGKLTEKFASLDPSMQQMIVQFAAIVAAIGPVTLIFGKLIGVVGKVASGLGILASAWGVAFSGATAATPIIASVAAVLTKLAAVFAVVKGAVIAFAASFGLPTAAVVAFGAAIATTVIAIITHWDEIKAKTSEIWGQITEFLGNVWQEVKESWNTFWTETNTWLSETWNNIKESASTIFESIKEFIGNAWENTKTKTSEVWEGIKTWLSEAWEALKTKAEETFNGINTKIVEIWNALKTKTSEIWEGIKSTLETLWNGLKDKAKSTFDDMKSNLSTTWENIKSSASSAWEGIKKAIEDPINKAKEAVNNAIEKIKNILNITLPFPKIKLPHFKISGSFSLDPPSVPSFGVDWYDKGGIFKSPSIIGVGEKRPEFVGALEDLRHLIGSELDRRNQGGDILITGNNFNVRDDNDIKKIAQELYKLQQKESRGRGLVVG